MGGQLELDSTPGEGSRFHFELSLAPADALSICPADESQRILRLAPGFRLHALVVDDVVDNREVLCRLLQTAGIETDQAIDGADALVKLEQAEFDVVFMDVRMPVMDGIAALKAIRRRWPERKLVCIAITASSLLRQAAYYQDAGFDDYLAKPFLFEKVCERLEKHLAVTFERKSGAATASGAADIVDLSGCCIPTSLHSRLLRAAETNALSDLEQALADLRARDHDSHRLAEHFTRLASNYDTEGIAAELRNIGAIDD